MFKLDFTLNLNTKRVCLSCRQPIAKNSFTMLVSFGQNGVMYEAAHHWQCVEESAEDFLGDDKYPSKYVKLKERITSSGELFS